MIFRDLGVWHVATENRIIEKLPDGSTAVFDTLTKTVHSINKIATAAFEACREKRTMPQVATAMREILESPVTEEMALAALYELERVELVVCSVSPEERPQASRRSVLRVVGTAATVAPLVLSLSSAEQSAYAAIAGSGTTTTTTTTTTSTTTTTTTPHPAPSITGSEDANAVCTNSANPQAVEIVGQNTHFIQGSSIVMFSVPWFTVTDVQVDSATGITVTGVVQGSPPSGSGTFGATVVTGSETVTGINIFGFVGC